MHTLVCTCLVVLAAVAASAEQQFSSNDEFAVDITSKWGNRLQFPYFSPEVKQIDPKLRELLVEDAQQILAEFSGTLHKRLTAKGGYFGFMSAGLDWTVLGGKLIKIDRAQEARKKKLAVRRVGTKGMFNKAMQSMFKEMVEMAKVEAVKLEHEPKNNLKLAQDIEIYLSDLQEAVESSVVAGYFKWSDGTINGENFMSYSARIMGRLRNHGYDGVFACVSRLLDMIVKFQG